MHELGDMSLGDMSLDTHFLCACRHELGHPLSLCMSLDVHELGCMSLDTHFLYRHCHLDQRDGNVVGLTGLL